MLLTRETSLSNVESLACVDTPTGRHPLVLLHVHAFHNAVLLHWLFSSRSLYVCRYRTVPGQESAYDRSSHFASWDI